MKTFHHAAAPTIFLAIFLTSPTVWSADQPKAAGYVSVVPSEMKWSDAPSIGPGVKIAVIEGDLKAAGPVTFRIKLPPKSKVAVHTHPILEHFTVLSGTFYFAIGDKYEASKAKAYPVGGFSAIQPGVPMFAYTKDKEAIIQVHGIGPWGINYMNPEDAPGKKK